MQCLPRILLGEERPSHVATFRSSATEMVNGRRKFEESSITLAHGQILRPQNACGTNRKMICGMDENHGHGSDSRAESPLTSPAGFLSSSIALAAGLRKTRSGEQLDNPSLSELSSHPKPSWRHLIKPECPVSVMTVAYPLRRASIA